jgi:hypothetical protein
MEARTASAEGMARMTDPEFPRAPKDNEEREACINVEYRGYAQVCGNNGLWRMRCSRTPGHTGDHVAAGGNGWSRYGGSVFARWPQSIVPIGRDVEAGPVETLDRIRSELVSARAEVTKLHAALEFPRAADTLRAWTAWSLLTDSERAAFVAWLDEQRGE